MSGEVKSLRINDPELETWVDEHVNKGDLNPLMNSLLLEYRQKQEQEYIETEREEKLDRKITIVQGSVIISIAVFFFVFAASMYYPFLSFLASVLMVFCGILLCIYVAVHYKLEINKAIQEAE
jgi:archaellum biogenesis protein FlaJ (TadC family)